MLSFYLTRIPVRPNLLPELAWVVPSPPTAARFLGPSSFPGPAGHELGHSWQLPTPRLASAPEVTPGDFRASSWRSGVRGSGLSSPSAASPTQVGLTRDPHPASHWGFLETIWGVKKKKSRQLPTGRLGQGSLLGGTSAPGRAGPMFSKAGQRLCRDRLRPG